MKDFAIILENKPGALAHLGEVLGKENINMEALSGAVDNEGDAIIHLLVEEPGRTYGILKKNGFTIKDQRDVLVISIKDMVKKPGTGAGIFRTLAQEGINIDLIYLAENSRIVLGVDDLEKARTIL